MRKIIFLYFVFLYSSSVFCQNTQVIITDHNGNSSVNNGKINIDCNYNFIPSKIIELTATFPEIKSPTTYAVATITYAPVAAFSSGTATLFTSDESWSPDLQIGFPFCFYGNNYTSLNLADNGIIKFDGVSTVPSGTFSTISDPVPSQSIVKNAIFAGFQDYLLTTGAFGCVLGDDCGSVRYQTAGVAPFRRFIINYNLVNHWGCSNPLNPINLVKSTFQVVLYETTNIIEIYVDEKPLTCATNANANGDIVNSLIGLNNSTGLDGIAAPNRNTSVWSANDEAYRFTPNGASITTVQWFNSSNPSVSIGSSNPIQVIPTSNTSYTVKVNYATCTPKQIEDSIDVIFDLNYPLAPNVIGNYCDVAPPFFNQDGINVENLLIDPTDLPLTIKTIHATQNEANFNLNPISGLDNYTMNTASQIFFYRETIGVCFVTGQITLNLFATPQLNDQIIDVCDLDNNGSEQITLSALNAQIIGYNASTIGLGYFQDSGATVPLSVISVNAPPGFEDIYIKVRNLSKPDCFVIRKLTLRILPKLILNPITTFCVADPNFDGVVLNNDLTTIAISVANVPTVIPTYTYYTNANLTNLILNPSDYTVNIQQPATSNIIYILANAPGYCPTSQSVTVTICAADGGDGGNGGGNDGFGGAGFAACLEVGDMIPSFDLNGLFAQVMLPITPAPATNGFYSTLLAAQNSDAAFKLPAGTVANYTPNVIAPALFDQIWVRFTDANNNIGIKRLIIPVKFKKHETVSYDICDVNNDNIQSVDLRATSQYILPIIAANPGEAITCYGSQNDYDSDTNPITSFNVTPTNNTVYVKVASFGCNSDYKLIFTLNPFIIKTPIAENLCDINADGTENANLSTILSTIIPDYSTTSVFSIHSTLNGAYNQTGTISNATTNYPVNATTSVFIRITENPLLLPLICPTIQEIDFGFFESIAINAIAPINICDTDNDGQVQTTNLNSTVASIISTSNSNPIISRLYKTLNAAQNNVSGLEILANWDDFIYDLADPNIINGFLYLYLENSITGCKRIVPIQYIMQSIVLPTSNLPLKICDFSNDGTEQIPNLDVFNTQIVTVNPLLYNYQYFFTAADAIAGSPLIPTNFVATDNYEIWVKITTVANATCSKIKKYVIMLTPAPTAVDITPKICDDLGDNQETRNLNIYQSQIITNPANHTFRYFASYAEALNNLNQIGANYTINFNASNSSAPVFARVTDNLTTCFSIAKITFERIPIIDAYDEQIFTCDVSTTNALQGIFDLTSVIPRNGSDGMIANPSNYTITYWTTLAAATAATTTSIPDPTNFAISAQSASAYVRFADKITGCFTVKRIELLIYNLPKFAANDFYVCDDNLDAIYSVNLNSLNQVVVLQTSLFTFSYYRSNANAIANLKPLPTNTDYTLLLSEFPKQIFVKGTSIANGCSQIRPVTLLHKPEIPLVKNNATLLKCDPNNDDVEIFNLTDANTQITLETGVVFKYYTSFADAQANNANFIPNETTYSNTVNGQEVFVRMSKSATNCDSWAKIKLTAFHEEYTFPAIETLCDNNNNGSETINLEQIVLGYISPLNLTTIALKFYNSNFDANVGTNIGLINNPNSYLFTNFSTNIFVRITNIASGCPIVKKINFVSPTPILLTNQTFNICDFNRNTSENIKLSDYFQTMTVNPVSNYTISCYNSEFGANGAIGADLISNSSYLQNQPQKLYWIRFVDTNGCYSVASIIINIIVYPNSNTAPPILYLCDTNNSSDLSEIFDLTINENYIRNGNATDIISYHATQSEAQLGVNNLSNRTSYPSGNASIWIRVTTDPASSISNCAIIIEQQIRVIPLPVPALNPPVLKKCDSDAVGNLSEIFDLTQNENFIKNGNPSYLVSYHRSIFDAQNGTNKISNPQSFSSITATIYVRITTNPSPAISTCAIVVAQQLEVVPLPNPNLNPPLLQLCDDTNAGDLKEFFNLATNSVFIKNGNPSYLLTYHTTQQGAQNDTDEITNNISNYESLTGSIWIRVTTAPESTIANCAVTVEQKLKVNPLPLAGIPKDFYACKSTVTGLATFNLLLKNDEVFNGQSPLLFTVTYHTTETAAKQGINALPTTYGIQNTTNIWASVSNNSSLCRNTSILKLIPEVGTTATQPNPAVIEICDQDELNDGFTKYDLSVLNATILGGQFGNANYSINYYASELDYNNNLPIPILQEFINNSNEQTVFIRVVNNATVNKCEAKTSFKLKIIKLPETNPIDGVLCYNQTTSISTPFTINSGLSNVDYTFEWFFNASTTAILGQTDSTLTVLEVGDYYVIATSKTFPNCSSKVKVATITKSESALATAKVEYSFGDSVSIIVTATGIGDYNFQIDSNPVQDSNIFKNVGYGLRQITVYDKNGCDSITISVLVLEYDRFFTPNGDGFNDYWNIKGIANQPNSKVYIYDRYGKLLKEISPLSEGWNGMYNGQQMPADDYWFTVNYVENGEEKIFKSHFAMKR